ncbi:DUF1214 domain-containing protein [Nocardia sp. NPDC056064]|uniref:DUF1214 domain-containing protein n=1 Tax=Nocardia sp. NPDC056064 TaxID=3345701 RepID=UPI0035D84525
MTQGRSAAPGYWNGYPARGDIARAYDELDYNRALAMYRFFYPTVSFEATWRGNLDAGAVPNRVMALLVGTPDQYVFTANSDTPYSGLTIDLSDGPMVVDIPAGPLMGTANDLNQLWVLDLGLPGPAGAAGGKHVLLPPSYDGPVPEGYYAGSATTNRVLVLVRALPEGSDVEGTIERMKQVRVYPLGTDPDSNPLEWVDISTQQGLDLSPVYWETGLDYWQVLHEILQTEPPNPDYRYQYGELAALGITRDAPFAPDRRQAAILTDAARRGHLHLCVQSFADRRPDRVVWPDSRWEWAVLRPENGTFDTGDYVDLYAREKWFYQAQIESPAMFARHPGAGSLYWLGLRDVHGDYLDGGGYYSLTVPQPVPAKLFWSVTVYDARTRSEIQAPQNRAALRSMFELTDVDTEAPLTVYFGPTPPPNTPADRWVQTVPGAGWFAYFRIYGPEGPAFDGTWQLPDFRRH